MYSLRSKKFCFKFYPQRQNISASKTLDLPDPLGPTMLVNPKKGPVKVSYSKNMNEDILKDLKFLMIRWLSLAR